MASKSGSEFHSYWGSVSGPTELPNVSGASIQDTSLEVGDTCYSISDTSLYFCTTATVGSAVWSKCFTTDIRSSYIVVGNSATDSAVDCDVLDTGDGAGIESALSSASAGPYDVYIRPGTYNLQSGSVTTPMSIPAGVRVRGAGTQATVIQAKTNGDDQGVFSFQGADAVLEDVGLYVPLPATGTGTGGDNAVVTITSARCLCQRVEIEFQAGWDATYAGRCSLRAAFSAGIVSTVAADDAKFVDCNATPLPSFYDLIGGGDELICYAVYTGAGNPQISATIDRCQSSGGDYSILAEHITHVTNSRLYNGNVAGVYLSGSDASHSLVQGNRVIISGTLALGTEVGVLLDTTPTQCVVANNNIETALAAAGQIAISLVSSDKNTIVGNTGPASSSWTNAVKLDASSDGNEVMANNFGGTPTYVNSGSGNDVAHNL